MRQDFPEKGGICLQSGANTTPKRAFVGRVVYSSATLLLAAIPPITNISQLDITKTYKIRGEFLSRVLLRCIRYRR